MLREERPKKGGHLKSKPSEKGRESEAKEKKAVS